VEKSGVDLSLGRFCSVLSYHEAESPGPKLQRWNVVDQNNDFDAIVTVTHSIQTHIHVD